MLGGKENYKYSGILKADSIKQTEKNEKLRKEYIMIRKLLEIKFGRRNLIKGITWAISFVRYLC